MGIKRKASTFEEDESFQFQRPQRASTPSHVSSSPLSSTSTIGTFSSVSSAECHHYAPGHGGIYNVNPIPFLSSRTRKRHRDARPNEEIIHENTLKKLFDAQRLHLDEQPMLSSNGLGLEGSFEQPRHHGNGDEDTDMFDDDHDETMCGVELPSTAERDQRTLEAFFGGKAAAKRPTVSEPPRVGEGYSDACWPHTTRL